jgi:hypothetical protein
MTVNMFRRFLYMLSKYLGDYQALSSQRKGAIQRRVARRVTGKVLGRTLMRGIGKMWR